MALVKTKVDGRFADFSYLEDVEPVLDRNKLLASMEQTKTDGMIHVATIPNAILLQWLNEEWMRGSDMQYLSKEFNELVDRKLKDPDWAHLLVIGPRHKVGWNAP